MRHNFVGLSINSADLPDAQRALWTDLVAGKVCLLPLLLLLLLLLLQVFLLLLLQVVVLLR